MSKVIAIDHGVSKCGIILADLKDKTVCEALVIKSNLLLNYIKLKYESERDVQFLILYLKE